MDLNRLSRLIPVFLSVLFVSIAFLLLPVPLFAATEINKLTPSIANQVDSEAQRFLSGCSGLSVGMSYNDTVVYTKTYGNHGISDTHVYASVSKPITAIITMQLVEKGQLNLDTPVRTYVRDQQLSRDSRCS